MDEAVVVPVCTSVVTVYNKVSVITLAKNIMDVSKKIDVWNKIMPCIEYTHNPHHDADEGS